MKKLLWLLCALCALVPGMASAQLTGPAYWVGPITPGDCTKWLAAGVLEDAGGPCGTGGGGATLQTNGTNNSSQTTLNLQNSAATGGLTLVLTNPSGGNVQLGLSGWPALVSSDCLTNNGTTLSWGACGTGATLQTNGTNNSSQTVLNLANGTNVQFTNTSGGTVVPTVTEPIGNSGSAISTLPYTAVVGDCGKQDLITATGGGAFNLPAASGSFSGCQIDITVSGSGSATVTPASGTINGQSTLPVGSNQQCTANSDGTNWQVIACFAAMGSHTYLVDNGTQYTVSGTGACSAVTKTGTTGSATGEFECTGTTGSSTITLTLPSSVNNWFCSAHDVTTTANILAEGAGSSTSDTFSGTVNANDFIKFGCTGF